MQLAVQMRKFERSARRDAQSEWFGRWPSTVLNTATEGVSIARTESELKDIGQLRYDLYIERDGKRYGCVDHASRIFLEPIDDVSLNFQAHADGRLLAAVRLVRAEDAIYDKHLRLLVEAMQPSSIATTVVCSRFAVRSEHRARAFIKPMFQDAYRAAVLVGAKTCVLGTRECLVGIFEKFGFRRTSKSFSDEVSGQMTVLEADLYDLEHARQVASPLLAIAKELIDSDQDFSSR